MAAAKEQTGDVVGLVLCAGLGTRLRPLTERVPKPAVPVCGVPLIRWNLALLRGAGVRRAAINAHHLAPRMAAEARAAAAALDLELAVSEEAVIAGTGGALREARSLVAGADTVVVVNGDILFDVDVAAAVAAHRRSGALATMVLMPMPPGASYAAVETDAAGAVRRIAGRFGPGGDGLSPWHFTGVHVIAREVLDGIAPEPYEVDVNRHVYPPLMERGLVRGFVTSGYWNDLGTPARYLEATRDVLAGRVPLGRFGGARPFDGWERRTGARDEAVWVHPAAEVRPGAVLAGPCAVASGAVVAAGAVVGPNAFVGAGASIGAGARVSDAAVWESSSVAAGASVDRAIVAGDLLVTST